MGKGKLIIVQTGKNRRVKMYEADAIAMGYIKPNAAAPKARPAAENKMLTPAENKATKPLAVLETPVAEPSDDFTQIDGIGKGTARALQAHRIKTFDDLRKAGDLHFIGESARKSIEKWKRNG